MEEKKELQQETKRFNTRLIAMIGLMAALVFVGTFLRIKIPVGSDGTMLHFGNVFSLLAGLLFGGLPGGLAAGIGSGLFDLCSEYASEAWITFLNKFVMGFVAGLVAHWGRREPGRTRLVLAAVSGSLSYCVLYIAKTIVTNRFINGLPWEGVWPVVAVKGAVTLTNGLIAVVASLVLYSVLKPALVRAHILE